MKCESCAFWKRNKEDADTFPVTLGECRRYPPKVWVFGVDKDGKPVSGESVPERPADWWCGEHKTQEDFENPLTYNTNWRLEPVKGKELPCR